MPRKKDPTENCLVTGGAGFIGSHLLQHLLKENRYRKIYVLDLTAPRLQDPRIDFICCDIRNPIHLRVTNCKVIYHLAGLAKEPGFEWDEYFVTNMRGTENICEFASNNGIAKIIYTSTMMVYRSGDQRMAEDSITSPDTAYGMSKLLGERVLQEWVLRNRERSIKIIRAAVIFGKHENGNFTILARALKHRLFFYVGRKNTVKSCAYVSDLVRFCVWCADNKSRETVYNFALPGEITIEQVCKEMASAFGFPMPKIVIPLQIALAAGYLFELLNRARILRSPIHHRRIEKLYYSTNIDSSKCVKDGYSFQYSLRDGLEEWKRACNEGLS